MVFLENASRFVIKWATVFLDIARYKPNIFIIFESSEE